MDSPETVLGHNIIQEDGIKIFLSFNTPQKIAQLVRSSSHRSVIISMDTFCKELDDSLEFLPISLEDMSRFYQVLQNKKNSHQNHHIVICTGPLNRIQFGTIFLIGCYMLISGKPLSEVQFALFPFESLMSGFDCNGMTHQDFWSAFYRAQRNQWVTFWETEEEAEGSSRSIEIEEYSHYAR